MKIVSSGKALHTSEFHEKKKKARHLRLTIFISAIIILLGGFIILSRIDKFQIRMVEVRGSTEIRSDVIQEKVEENLSSSYLKVIPKSNRFLYPGGTIREELLAAMPRLKSLELNMADEGVLEVLVDEREPFALYCSSVPSVSLASDCYFLDESGFIFDLSPSFSGDVYFIYTGRLFEVPLGKQFLDQTQFEPLTEFMERLPALGVYARVLEAGEKEYHLFLPNGSRIMWESDDNLDIIYTNLSAFLLSDAIGGEKNFLDRISYLDLRTANKVFFRFRE